MEDNADIIRYSVTKDLQNCAIKRLQDFRAKFSIYIYEIAGLYNDLIGGAKEHIELWQDAEAEENEFYGTSKYFNINYFASTVLNICEEIDTIIAILSASNYSVRMFGNFYEVEYIENLKSEMGDLFKFLIFSSTDGESSLFLGAEHVYLPINSLLSQLYKIFEILYYC